MNLPVDANDPTAVQVVRFGHMVEQKSNGSLRFEVYYSGTLAKENAAVVGMQTGVLDLMLTGSEWLQTMFPQMEVLGLPFLFASRANQWRMLDGDIGRSYRAAMMQKGILPLAWGSYGAIELYTRDRRVTNPDDMRGLRIRVKNSPTAVSMMKVLGAIPLTIDFTEEFLALQQHTIDGCDGSPASQFGAGIYTIIKYVTLTDHVLGSSPLLMNLQRFNALSAAEQKAILDAARDFQASWRKAVDAGAMAAINDFATHGVSVGRADKAAFRKAMSPIYDEYRTKLGADDFDRVIKLAGA